MPHGLERGVGADQFRPSGLLEEIRAPRIANSQANAYGLGLLQNLTFVSGGGVGPGGGLQLIIWNSDLQPIIWNDNCGK